MPSITGRIASFVKRKTSQKYKFNLQYEQKKWEGMRDIADLGRYSIIVGFVRYYFKNPRILDLGCGEGILLEKFASTDYTHYTGIDFSDVAIDNARKMGCERADFAVGDLNKLSVDGTFDAIIYNESLYYLNRPQAAVSKLVKNVAAGGKFIFSMVDKRGHEREGLWNELNEILKPVDKSKVTNANGDSWTIVVYEVRR
jgi:2-polyprenyl-3-methyl-5-hydroxy-6-metoxy-1,4-benzoquinol methylase